MSEQQSVLSFPEEAEKNKTKVYSVDKNLDDAFPMKITEAQSFHPDNKASVKMENTFDSGSFKPEASHKFNPRNTSMPNSSQIEDLSNSPSVDAKPFVIGNAITNVNSPNSTRSILKKSPSHELSAVDVYLMKRHERRASVDLEQDNLNKQNQTPGSLQRNTMLRSHSTGFKSNSKLSGSGTDDSLIDETATENASNGETLDYLLHLKKEHHSSSKKISNLKLYIKRHQIASETASVNSSGSVHNSPQQKSSIPPSPIPLVLLRRNQNGSETSSQSSHASSPKSPKNLMGDIKEALRTSEVWSSDGSNTSVIQMKIAMMRKLQFNSSETGSDRSYPNTPQKTPTGEIIYGLQSQSPLWSDNSNSSMVQKKVVLSTQDKGSEIESGDAINIANSHYSSGINSEEKMKVRDLQQCLQTVSKNDNSIPVENNNIHLLPSSARKLHSSTSSTDKSRIKLGENSDEHNMKSLIFGNLNSNMSLIKTPNRRKSYTADQNKGKEMDTSNNLSNMSQPGPAIEHYSSTRRRASMATTDIKREANLFNDLSNKTPITSPKTGLRRNKARIIINPDDGK